MRSAKGNRLSLLHMEKLMRNLVIGLMVLLAFVSQIHRLFITSLRVETLPRKISQPFPNVCWEGANYEYAR